MQIRFSRARELSEQLSFILLLCSTLLTLIKIPLINIGIHNILIPLFALLIIGLRINVMKEVFERHRRTIIVIGMLYLWMWISALHSEYQNTAIKYGIKYSYYPLMFIAFLALLYNCKHLYIYYRLVFYFLLLIGVFGIIEEVYPKAGIFYLLRPYETYMPRVASLMQNPNPFGSLMSLGVIYSILLRKDGTLYRSEFIIGTILFTLFAFLSGSRNAVIVLLMGLIILAAYREIKFTKEILKWLIFISGVIYLYYIYLGDHANYILHHYLHGESSYRILIWKRALYEIAHNPIFGIGIEVFSKHIGTQVLGQDIYHTHNIVLNILVELGVVGLILSLLFIFNLFKGINYSDPRITMPILMIFAAQIFDYYLHDVTYAAIVFYFMAVAANSKNEHFQKPHLAT
jgi:O-antigen ligase